MRLLAVSGSLRAASSHIVVLGHAAASPVLALAAP